MTKEQQHILDEFGVDNYEELFMTHVALLHDILRFETGDRVLKWLFHYAEYMEKEMCKYEKAQADSTAHA